MPNTDSKTNTVGWGNINWRKVERYVFKLQKRIYAASRRGHCHDTKTALDMEQIRKNSRQKHLKAINLQLVKHNWFWDENDILVVSKSRCRESH
jgi:hypothetical protein